jgi:hypothetical protein
MHGGDIRRVQVSEQRLDGRVAALLHVGTQRVDERLCDR